MSVFLSFVPSISWSQTTTYTDTQGRFSINVPKACSLAPQFGDLSGIRFRCERGRLGGQAWFSVRVLERTGSSVPASAQIYEKTYLLEDSWQGIGEFRRVRGNDFAGLNRKYRRQSPQGTTGARFLSLYLKQFRGSTVAFEFALEHQGYEAHHRSDLRVLLSTFRWLGQSSSVTPGIDLAELLGTWERGGDESIEFSQQGQFVVQKKGSSKKDGKFRLEGNRLRLSTSKDSVFEVSLENQGRLLRLKSSRIRSDLIYHRVRQKRQTGSIVGRWAHLDPSNPLELVFQSNQRFQIGESEGRWSLVGSSLKITGSDGIEIVYQIKKSRGFILISGGDLQSEANFRKIPGSETGG